MKDAGRHSVLGVMVNAMDYESAILRIVNAVKLGEPLAVTALAVHGVMTGHMDPQHRTRLNRLDLVLPDGQPVRWALNALHGCDLKDRVYGPDLTLRVLAVAQHLNLPVYFYGSTEAVLGQLQSKMKAWYPNLQIAGAEPSRFRNLTVEEKGDVVARIKESGAKIVFVGLGCPRQEVWAYEYREELSMPILAVGAAFDFHAGNMPQAPRWMQQRGLEWLFRLKTEPRRLWRRYVILNPSYLALIAAQKLGLRRFPRTSIAVETISYG